MTETTAAQRPPAPDFTTLTQEELITWRTAENRFRASDTARPMLGEPDPDATIGWERIALPGRELPVRVYRPASGAPTSEDAGAAALPLVLHVHGGGFVGTATQCDWANSHLAAHLPAVVVSVEHRLLAPDTPLSDAVADAWDVLELVLREPDQWGVDPERVAVFGESCGALISALTAIRAGRTGLRLRAQVLVNPAVDVTESLFDYPSMTEYAETATAGVEQLRLVQQFSATPGSDPRELSPLYAELAGGLAPALVVVPTADPLADHGRRYADRLWTAGVDTHLTEYPDAPHAFLTLPGLVPQAQAARTEIFDFLRLTLT
ncbi:alpha/beta hydrolase [Catenulispora pinisilvae]|uniref:alpha/beta hydrolase n=1 Tax=Catenulispora pinisilvae TaxID=2705253 RepID=UPI001890F100|nr:alpha/beta hydrolase [Catenulispora pinisilvae]